MIFDTKIFYKLEGKQQKIDALKHIGFDIDLVTEQKIMYEDLLLKAYKCPQGVWTIGVGATFYPNGEKVSERDMISLVECMKLLEYHTHLAYDELKKLLSIETFNNLDPVRESVLIDLIFNMGRPRLSQFKKMLKAIDERDYIRASLELEDSLYFKQTGQRARDNVRKMRRGH